MLTPSETGISRDPRIWIIGLSSMSRPNLAAYFRMQFSLARKPSVAHLLLLLIVFSGPATAQTSVSKVWIADNGDGTYRNPILHADYSDPDVVRVGDDFYLVASSFNAVPGVPILHSRDLVNW